MIDQSKLQKQALIQAYDSKYSKYQTIKRRFFASFVDSLVVTPILLISLIFFITLYLTPFSFFLYSFISSLSLIAYNVYMLNKYGATIGKSIMGLEVVHFQNEGKISITQSVFRESLNIVMLIYSVYAIYMVLYNGNSSQIEQIITGNSNDSAYSNFMFLSSFIVAIELITGLFNKKRRALHDYFGQTVVVVKKQDINKKLYYILFTASIISMFLIIYVYGLYRNLLIATF